MNSPDTNPLDPRQELAAIRRRVLAVETELLELNVRVAGLEKRIVAAAPPSASPVLVVAAPALMTQSQVEPPLLTPPLPPVIASPERVAPSVATVELPPRNTDWARLRAALQQFQLWPPSGESNAEVRLGAWWSTRVGALLAVIGVVFFGIYVSVNTPPWVKLTELLAVVTGVSGLGLWLERRVPKFGAVIFGGGLALLYFSAYAAYSVPAVRVLEEAWQAVAAQLAAVAIVFAAAWWRRSPVVATMAVALGYVAGWFSFSCDLGTLALGMATVLAMSAAGLRLARGWEAPAALAMPLAYAIFARLAVFTWPSRAGDRLVEGWVWVVGLGTIFFFSDWLAAWRGGAPLNGRMRALQSVNSSFAVLLGLAVTLHLRSGALTNFYLGASVLCAVVALAWRHLNRREPLVAVFACKAAGLVALAVITEWSGHVRALVLLTQAIVVLVAARESGLKSLRVMSTVVWGAALLFFTAHIARGTGALNLNEVIVAVAVMLGASLWSGWNERWLGGERAWHLAGGGALGFVGALALEVWNRSGWSPALGVAIAAAALAGGVLSRGWAGPVLAAGLALLAAHIAMIGYARGLFPAEQLWSNEVVLLVAALAAAWALQRRREIASGDQQTWLAGVRFVLAAAAVVALQVTWFKALASAPALAAAVGTAVMLMAGAGRARGWSLAGLSTLALALGWWSYDGPLNLRSGVGLDAAWLGVAALGAWIPAVWFTASATRRESMDQVSWREWTPALQTALATVVTLLALHNSLEGATRVGAVALVVLGIAALAWRPGLMPALTAASVVLGLGAVWVGDFGRNADSGEIFATVALAVVMAGAPVLMRRFVGEGAASWRRWAAWVHPIVAWLVLAALFIRQGGAPAPYATMLCGLAAIALFLLGLFTRERAARLAGLGGLVLCVPRVFVVDIDSTLYRIGAFVVLGVVLLWVGFSYHRFRHFITDDAPADENPGNK